MATETPVKTPLGEIAELLREVQRDLSYLDVALSTGGMPRTAKSLTGTRDKLMQASILVDVERGDGT